MLVEKFSHNFNLKTKQFFIVFTHWRQADDFYAKLISREEFT